MSNRQFLKACHNFDAWMRRRSADDLATGAQLWQAVSQFIEETSSARPAFDFESAIRNFAALLEEWRKYHGGLCQECNERPHSDDDERIYAYPV